MNGFTIQAILYDKNGDEIRGVPQTTVGGQSGVFYMSLVIRASNPPTNDVQLTNLRMTESHDDSGTSVFTQALQGANALQSTLAVAESNVLAWDTANTCSTDVQCGTPAERCRGTVTKKCLIDISNFNKEITFGATLVADFVNAKGVSKTTTTVINLPILFEQDAVIFRTNNLNSDYGDAGDEIAVDRNGDGNLEAYIYSTGGSELYQPSMFITWTVQDNIVFRCGTTQICVSVGTGLNKDSTFNPLSRSKYILGGSLPITPDPLEPYLSDTCGGTIPCQEKYSVAVAPPSQTCGNNAQEGTELCDGTDLKGNSCTSVPGSFTGGTLACLSNGQCNTWDTSACTGGAVSVTFRTTDLSYESAGLAYDLACGGNPLSNVYGYETSYDIPLSGRCESRAVLDDCTSMLGKVSCILLDSLPGGINPRGDGNVTLYQDDLDVNEVWICERDADRNGYSASRYDKDDCPNGAGFDDCVGLSDSGQATFPTFEKTC